MSEIDVIYITVTALAVAIAVILSVAISNPILFALNESFGTSSPFIPQVVDKAQAAFNTLDMAVVVLIYGMGILAVALAFYVRSHPVYYFFALIGNIIVLVIAPQLSNAYFDFIAQPAIAPTAAGFQLTTLLFQYLPVILLGISVLITIAMLGKGGGEPVSQL